MISNFNPPQNPGLAELRTFQDLRDKTTGWVGRFFDYVQSYFNSTLLPRLNTQNYSFGPDIASATAINFTNLIHRVTGTASIQTINIPAASNFSGLLVLFSRDGFSTVTGGNILQGIMIPAGFMAVCAYHAGIAMWDVIATSGTVGPPGPPGATGPTGATGPAGATGATGPAGPGTLATAITPIAVPVLSSFTIHNQGTATIIDSAKGIFMLDNNTPSHNWRSILQSAPATPYTIRALLAGVVTANASGFGLGWRDNSTSKLQLITFAQGSGVANLDVQHFSNDTTFVGNDSVFTVSPIGNYCWFELIDDGTTAKAGLSFDGVNFFIQYSIAKSSSYLGSSGFNQVGVFLDPSNSAPNLGSMATVLSYSMTSS